MKFVATQLGHTDETMLSRVYLKAGIEQRHELALEEMSADTERTIALGTP